MTSEVLVYIDAEDRKSTVRTPASKKFKNKILLNCISVVPIKDYSKLKLETHNNFKNSNGLFGWRGEGEGVEESRVV